MKNWRHASNTGLFLLATTIATAAVVVTSLAGWLFGADWPGWLELAAVHTSYACTLLFVLQRRQCYIWGLVTTLLYAELFRRYQLPASAAVQLYLLGALAYGWFRWGPDGNPLPVSWVRPLGWWVVYLGLTAVTFGGAWYLSKWLGSPIAGWDGAILATTILAQWLLDNKKMETWMVWISVNVMVIPVCITQGLYLVAAQYVVFLLNAVWGLYEWRNSMLDDALMKSRAATFGRSYVTAEGERHVYGKEDH